MTFDDYLASIGWDNLKTVLDRHVVAVMRDQWDHQQKEIDRLQGLIADHNDDHEYCEEDGSCFECKKNVRIDCE